MASQNPLRAEDGEARLGPYDSVHLASGEARSAENRTNLPASMLVVIPDLPQGS